MFKIEKNNEKIGAHLEKLIRERFSSRRAFCKAYIYASGQEPTDEMLTNMSNRLMQIIKGNKAIQTYDLPYFTELLGVACEHILSCGEYSVPLIHRVTNYSIACSTDPAEWKKYIHREDRLILNSDEYGKTVLDYAIEFKNYAFIKYLMDNHYIWFDSRKDADYFQTFGAGTSIERRKPEAQDYGLPRKLREEDELRIRLIALAADNKDMDMLNELRARESPQLYYRAQYLCGEHPDFDQYYDEKMVKYIANSSEEVLDYFTEAFNICQNIKYSGNVDRTHRFMFPYISQLLDCLVENHSSYTLPALKKAIKHNKETYCRLCDLVRSVKNNEFYSQEHTKDLWIAHCQKEIHFFENGNIVMFRAVFHNPGKDGLITNVPYVTQTRVASTEVDQLVKELNESYQVIRNFKDNLGSISI